MSEQEDEMMSLEAIYGEDYVAGSATSFRVRIQPSLGGQAEKVWVSCTLEVEYTPGYPGDLAVLRLTDVVGLSALQCGELEGRVGATALELQGGPCVYGVVECVREWLSERNVKPSDGSAFDEMMREKRAKEAPVAQQGALSREMDPSIKNKAVSSSTEEDEGVRRRRDGTPVTPESFAKWSAAFEAEMAKVKEEEEAAARKACVGGGLGEAKGGGVSLPTFSFLQRILAPFCLFFLHTQKTHTHSFFLSLTHFLNTLPLLQRGEWS